MPTLILLRHGQSMWNQRNIFTGWVDVPLSAGGIDEAVKAGQQIANTQIEAMMRNHALSAQCFVVCSSSPVTREMIDFFESKLGKQELMTDGGGWTTVVQPFSALLIEPHSGLDEKLVSCDIDMTERDDTKLWVDSIGHYSRPDVMKLYIDKSHKKTTIINHEQN